MIDRIGRKHLQLFGFAGEAVCFGLMAVHVVRGSSNKNKWIDRVTDWLAG